MKNLKYYLLACWLLIGFALHAQDEKAESLAGLRMAVIGDSYVRNHKEPVENTWHYKFAKKHNMEYFNFGRNGNCIAMDRARFGEAMYTRYAAMPDAMDYVVIIAGHNDAGKLDSIGGIGVFKERMAILCEGLTKKYPTAKIFVLTRWICKDFYGSDSQKVVDAMIEVCHAHNIPIFDCARNSGILADNAAFRQRYFQGPNDTAHLNAEGHDLFLKSAEEFLLNPASQTQADICVAKYKDNKMGAVSYTFDDGLAEHYTLVLPQFEKRNFKGTFWINGSKINEDQAHIADTTRMTWGQIKEMSDKGHEMSNHGWAHKNFGRFPLDEIKEDVLKNDSALFKHTGRMPRTFCYANNTKTPEGVEFVSRNRVGTRTFQRAIGSKSTPEDLEAWTYALIVNKDWGVGMTHGMTYGYDAFVDPQRFWDHLDRAKALEDFIWIDTFEKIVAYNKEREELKLTIEEGAHTITVTPSLGLDKNLFTQPLTMVLNKAGVREWTVTQKGKPLQTHTQQDKTLFDFDPYGGAITLSPTYK